MRRSGIVVSSFFFFFFQAEDGIRDKLVTGVQTCALPIYDRLPGRRHPPVGPGRARATGGGAHGPDALPGRARSEEHTSELQSLAYLVCRLLLEKKKKKKVEIM